MMPLFTRPHVGRTAHGSPVGVMISVDQPHASNSCSSCTSPCDACGFPRSACGHLEIAPGRPESALRLAVFFEAATSEIASLTQAPVCPTEASVTGIHCLGQPSLMMSSSEALFGRIVDQEQLNAWHSFVISYYGS